MEGSCRLKDRDTNSSMDTDTMTTEQNLGKKNSAIIGSYCLIQLVIQCCQFIHYEVLHLFCLECLSLMLESIG